jgi:hypothetical protein
MTRCLVALAGASMLGVALPALAADDFYGIIESRPEAKVGTWVVGGRSVITTESTTLEENHGPLREGACAEVGMEGDAVEGIESEPLSKCDKVEKQPSR